MGIVRTHTHLQYYYVHVHDSVEVTSPSLHNVMYNTSIHLMSLLGHRAYIGFLYLNYNYNNAVVHVFISLVQNQVKEWKSLTSNGSTVYEKSNSSSALPLVSAKESNSKQKHNYCVIKYLQQRYNCRVILLFTL